MIKRRNPSQTCPNNPKVRIMTPHGSNALDGIPEQEKVNRGRRRKTYQTREENKRDNPKRDRMTETTKSSLERRTKKFRERKIRDHGERGLKNREIRFK